MFALHDRIPRIKAERLLDAAQASAYPHLGRDGAQRWLDGLAARTKRVADRAALFTVNGVAMGARGLKAWAAKRFGPGLQR